jgi:hypothetical protein
MMISCSRLAVIRLSFQERAVEDPWPFRQWDEATRLTAQGKLWQLCPHTIIGQFHGFGVRHVEREEPV